MSHDLHKLKFLSRNQMQDVRTNLMPLMSSGRDIKKKKNMTTKVSSKSCYLRYPNRFCCSSLSFRLLRWLV